MKTTKTRAGSGDALVLILLALSSFPVATMAFDQDVQAYRRGAEYDVYSETIRLSLSTPIVEQVQLALRQRGYYSGEIDGFMGENTQISIQGFMLITAIELRRWSLAGF